MSVRVTRQRETKPFDGHRRKCVVNAQLAPKTQKMSFVKVHISLSLHHLVRPPCANLIASVRDSENRGQAGSRPWQQSCDLGYRVQIVRAELPRQRLGFGDSKHSPCQLGIVVVPAESDPSRTNELTT